LKTGNEFAKEVLSAEDNTATIVLDGTVENENRGDEDEEEEDDDDLYAYDGMDNDMTKQTSQPVYTDKESTDKLQSEMQSIKNENHDIILNLSKNTLRNILMLLCDEGVSWSN
jgi:hypothetical protein